jgi:hypothetical protein
MKTVATVWPSLESWLASASALQLPLHQIEAVGKVPVHLLAPPRPDSEPADGGYTQRALIRIHYCHRF